MELNQTGKGLGRLPAADERDRRFMMSSMLPRKKSKKTIKYWWNQGLFFDQGPRPICVAASLSHLLADGPITTPGPDPVLDPEVLYAEAKRMDEWDGEDYDGTSVRGGCKALKARGLIAEYRWAFDLETVEQTLLEVGPVVIGTYWFSDMDFPDKEGIVKISGRALGGHAYLLNGINLKRGLIRAKNSWGRSWGIKGQFWIPMEGVEELLNKDGEAAVVTEQPLGPNPE